METWERNTNPYPTPSHFILFFLLIVFMVNHLLMIAVLVFVKICVGYYGSDFSQTNKSFAGNKSKALAMNSKASCTSCCKSNYIAVNFVSCYCYLKHFSSVINRPRLVF